MYIMESSPIIQPTPIPALRWLRFAMESLVSLHKIKTKRKPQESFGQRLAPLRRDRGLTQRQLAAATSIFQRMIAYYETRVVSPPADIITRLVTERRASADDLLGFKPVAARPEPPFTIVELRLWRKFRELRNLPEDERRAVIKVVDSFLTGHRAANG
jgi:transcriptional regulator with XRE-family HTH domain